MTRSALSQFVISDDPGKPPGTAPSPDILHVCWGKTCCLNGPLSVKLDSLSSSTLTLNTGAPQGCTLSPLLCSLLTHDCGPVPGSNTTVKFVDDPTVGGLIRGNDETAYRDKVQHLDNNLALNTHKTKDTVDFS